MERRATRDLERIIALEKIHEWKRIEWPEELLSRDLFQKEYYLLSPRERMIMELKIQGVTNEDISSLLGLKLHTIRNRVRDIRYKYRTGCRDRVDNLAFIRRNRKWIAKQRQIVRGGRS